MLYSKVIGEGKPFIILHGFLGMSDNWKTLGTEFSTWGFQVHLLDLRNHGRSLHSNDFSYPIMAADVEQYCAAHKLQNIILLGHSMGGKVAMELACTQPNLVEKLIVADIGVKYYPAHHQEILEGLNAIDFSINSDRSAFDDLLKSYIPDFGTRQFLLKNIYRKTTTEFAFRFNLKTLTEKYNEIGVALPFNFTFNKEVLFLRGSKSNYILQSDWNGILAHFPKAKLEEIKNAGHWLHSENPFYFSNSIQLFLT